MSGSPKPLALLPAQRRATAPLDHAWVSASAGTGKTQVLAARVLRLLLAGVEPAQILCITFTKQAAAEMQDRVTSRLALWARAGEAALVADLEALGEAADLAGQTRARRLFARLLDAPQGLAVQTIHALAQSLLASFPVEAGVAPGFRTLEDRAAAALRRERLHHVLEEATARADQPFLDDVAALVVAGGEQKLSRLMSASARHSEALAGLPADAGLVPLLRRGFGLASDRDGAADLAEGMAGIDAGAVRALADRLQALGGKRQLEFAGRMFAWAEAPGEAALLTKAFLKTDGTAYDGLWALSKSGEAAGLTGPFNGIAGQVLEIMDRQRLHLAVAAAALHLRVARRLALDWAGAKARAGVIDYDDMIAAACRLLAGEGAAEWVRYKLDQRISHVLVDEAQDTNAAQWAIIGALTEEYFAGKGANEAPRRLFVVGDYKQAIYRFQGSDPRIFDERQTHFAQLASDSGEPLQEIALDTNFRSVKAVLDVVDAVAAALPEGLGLDPRGYQPHLPHRLDAAGAVRLLPPTLPRSDADADAEADDEAEEEEEESKEGKRPGQTELDHVYMLARMIRRWLDPHAPLWLPARGRPVRAEDILVLVRSRAGYSAALVAALHSCGVAVAGVDRMKLSEPLAVTDLTALIRFAVQPDDDLTLAALLVSPFIGLNHEALFKLAHGREKRLWATLKASADPALAAPREWLEQVLRLADLSAPYEFLESVLSGPLGGRSKLLARLGAEARDAIDRLLEQALAFEAGQPVSLQGFLAWLDAEDIELKRDPEAPLNEVRLMTVHGAKGLQAPVVILADAGRKQKSGQPTGLMMSLNGGDLLPIDPGPAAPRTGPLGAALDEAEREEAREYWRLLYVALTRAEDLLYVTGVAKRDKHGEVNLPGDSWYVAVSRAMAALEADWTEDAHHGPHHIWTTGTPVAEQALEVAPEQSVLQLPDRLRGPAPVEARPSRPLSPSALASEAGRPPAASPAMLKAAQRGQALHKLFERLPGLPAADRRRVGMGFAKLLLPDCEPAALVDEVLAVLEDPAHAALFGPGSLAEAPVAAALGETVIAGTIDRLLVRADRVDFVDFKTSRRVPGGVEALDAAHLVQMAAYAVALERIFPGRAVHGALLFTAGPKLIALPPALLAEHAPKLLPPVPLQTGGAALILPDD